MELLFTQNFKCDENNPYEDAGGLLILSADLWRTSFATDGMNGPLEVSLGLKCDVDEHSSFLTSGYLSKLRSVCS